MINFQKIKIEDRKLIESFYKYKTIKNCETAFANLCAWKFKFNAQYAIIDNTLIVRICHPEKGGYCYFCPIGEGNKVEIMRSLIAHSREGGEKMQVMVDCKEMFDTHFSDYFTFYENRDFFDYVYLRQSLATLSGKKLQSKRNHINKFMSLYPNYEYISLSEANAKEVLCLDRCWKAKRIKDNALWTKEYDEEESVIRYFMENFSALGLIGGALVVEGKMIAFTIGSKVNNETFDTHIEKASLDYEGAFTVINRDLALHLPENYIYINREEDLGIEGLRRAKLSYAPYEMINKTMATLKDE
jgi:Uncharacterized conserved protein